MRGQCGRLCTLPAGLWISLYKVSFALRENCGFFADFLKSGSLSKITKNPQSRADFRLGWVRREAI
jgi:hypothetical protein